MISIIHFFVYYKSFIKIVLLDKSPQNKLDLFHWTWFQVFNLWNKPIQKNGYTVKDNILDETVVMGPQAFFTKIIKLLLLNRVFVIILQLMLPFTCLWFGLLKNKRYFKLIQHPYYFIHKDIDFCIKYNLTEMNMLSMSYRNYIYNILKDENLCIGNKDLFNEFCIKYSISTVKCFKTLKELKQQTNAKESEFIIKPVYLACGRGIFLTKMPQKYLSQIPNVVIQPRLKNHESIINFTKNTKTLNTIRVCTFTKDSNLKPSVYLKCASNENCLVDNYEANKDVDYYETYSYNMETKLFTKNIRANVTLFELSHKDWDTFPIEIEGLNEFIHYINNGIHHKYLNGVIGIGWDVTKISNGDWIIIECNIFAGYYFSDPTYSQKICDQYIKKIHQLKQYNKSK